MGAPVEGRVASALGAIAGLAVAPVVLLLFLMGECWAGEGGGQVTAVASPQGRVCGDAHSIFTTWPAYGFLAAVVAGTVVSFHLRRRSDSWASGLLATAAPVLAAVAAYVVLALPSDTCSEDALSREPAWRCDTDADT